MAALLSFSLNACTTAATPDATAEKTASQTCAQSFKPETPEYAACLAKKLKEDAPMAEQMRRVRSDEDDARKDAQDGQRDYMSR